MKHDVNIRASVANIDQAVVANPHLRPELIENHNLSVSRREPDERVDFTRLGVIPETCSMNVIRGNDSFERRLNHLFGSRRDNVDGEFITVQISQKLRKQRDVLLQPDLFANCGEVLLANPPKFRVVQQQV